MCLGVELPRWGATRVWEASQVVDVLLCLGSGERKWTFHRHLFCTCFGKRCLEFVQVPRATPGTCRSSASPSMQGNHFGAELLPSKSPSSFLAKHLLGLEDLKPWAGPSRLSESGAGGTPWGQQEQVLRWQDQFSLIPSKLMGLT